MRSEQWCPNPPPRRRAAQKFRRRWSHLRCSRLASGRRARGSVFLPALSRVQRPCGRLNQCAARRNAQFAGETKKVGLTSSTMRASHLEDYYSFLRFPSVSTDAEYAGKVTECAHWVVEKLSSIGLETET